MHVSDKFDLKFDTQTLVAGTGAGKCYPDSLAPARLAPLGLSYRIVAAAEERTSGTFPKCRTGVGQAQYRVNLR
jgi:hypothetical protein